MTYRVLVTARAERELGSVPPPWRARVRAALMALGATPRPPGCVKLVGHDDVWRVRVGPYRIIYAIDDRRRIVVVTSVGHRRDVYR